MYFDLLLDLCDILSDHFLWAVRSDVTIGPAFKPNLKPDVISTIQEEIRMMKEANSTDSEGDNSSVNSNSPRECELLY